MTKNENIESLECYYHEKRYILEEIGKINRIKEILSEKNNVAANQEFGLSYGQVINYLDQIEEILEV